MEIDEEYLREALQQAIDNSIWKKEGKPDKIRKFDETLDIIINLKDLDLRNPNNRIDVEYLLPHSIRNGKLNLCIIGKGDIILEAKEKNVDAFDDKFLDELNKKDNKAKKRFVKKYDAFICQASLMRNVAKVLGRFLGQTGKMPKPQPKGYGIVSPATKIDKIIDNYRKTIKLKAKKAPIIQTIFGKKSLDFEKNLKNLKALIEFVESKLPNGKNNIRSIYLKTTMGKPVKVKEPEAIKKGKKFKTKRKSKGVKR
ncbi:MAG: hypothetical protein ACTSRZ_03275 [Promethearchaeota archaeon]